MFLAMSVMTLIRAHAVTDDSTMGILHKAATVLPLASPHTANATPVSIPKNRINTDIKLSTSDAFISQVGDCFSVSVFSEIVCPVFSKMLQSLSESCAVLVVLSIL